MSFPRVLAAGLALSTFLMLAERAEAVILAEDDFSAVGSGTGWEAASDWDGSVTGGITSYGNVNRNFATPIDPTAHDKLYIAFDYSQPVGDGSQWSGLALFEGVDATGDETLFIADPGQTINYGVDLKIGGATFLDSFVPVDTTVRRIIVELDLNAAPGTDSTRFWLDSLDLKSPTASSLDYDNTAIDAPWASARFAGEGSTTATADNFIIATTAAEVGLISTDATLAIDRSTGNVTLSSPTTLNNVVGYSLTSNGGAFNPSNWITITDNYDNAAGPGDGSVDSDDDWDVLSDPNSTTDASEFVFIGDGGTIDTTPVDLGSFWEKTPLEDVTGTIIIDDNGTPVPLTMDIVYTGTPVTPGDLDGDGDLDAADWADFKSGQGVVNNTMTAVEAYRMGDIDGDLDHSLEDYLLFEAAYDLANGMGSFTAMVQGIPEPTSMALLLGGALAACTCRRRRGQQAWMFAVAVLFSASLAAQPAQAIVFAEDDFSAEGSGTGWAVGDDWGNVQGGVADTTVANEVFRALASPLEPFLHDSIFIAFDFQINSSASWGGIAFFEGPTGGDETLFIGNPGQHDAYGVDLKVDLLALPEFGGDGVTVDTSFHRLIVELDFDDDGTAPFDDTYSLWVDNFNQNTPTNTTTINNSPIDAAWQSLRIGGDAGAGIALQVDNLIITDDPNLVFVPQTLEVTVNKTTGDVTLANNTGGSIDLSAYSISSETGMLNSGSLAGDFDLNGNVNGIDFLAWQRGAGTTYDSSDLADWETNYGAAGSAGSGWDSLADQDLVGFPAGDGSGNGWEEGDNPSPSELEEYYLTGSSTITDGASVSLGSAYGGGELGDENVVFQYLSDGQLRTAAVSYVTSGSISVVPEPACLTLAVFCASLFGGLRYRRQ